MKLFSYKDRPVHLGRYPQEELTRTDAPVDFSAVPPMRRLREKHDPESIAHSIHRFLALMDSVRDGDDVHAPAEIPADPKERAEHLKSAACYFDAALVSTCGIEKAHFLAEPISNSGVADSRRELEAQEVPSVSPRRPSRTIRILSSAEKCRRVLRRMSFTTCSAGILDFEDLGFIFVPSSLRRSPNPP